MRIADEAMLIHDGERLKTESKEYLKCITNIYQTVEELASSSWKGEKANKYISEIEGYRESLIQLGNQINNLGQGIVNAAKELEDFESSL